MSDVLARRDDKMTIFQCASLGDIETAMRQLGRGVDINSIDQTTGMSPLHYAVGRNRIAFARFLIERKARFFPDALGRMPSSIATICRCSEEMCDLIVEAEIAAESSQPSTLTPQPEESDESILLAKAEWEELGRFANSPEATPEAVHAKLEATQMRERYETVVAGALEHITEVLKRRSIEENQIADFKGFISLANYVLTTIPMLRDKARDIAQRTAEYQKLVEEQDLFESKVNTSSDLIDVQRELQKLMALIQAGA